MDHVRTIQHHGASIIYFDLSGSADRTDSLARIAAAQSAISGQPQGSVLSLTHVANAYVDDAVVRALGALAAANKPFVKAAAVVGAEGHLDDVRQLVAGMARRELVSFADIDTALNWLAEQA